MPACYCTYLRCNGQFVDDKTRKRHERFDNSQKYHEHTRVCRHFHFTRHPSLTSFQNSNSVHSVPEPDLQDMIPSPPTQIDTLVGPCNVESRKEHTHWQYYQTLATKPWLPLVELEQKVKAQTRATQALKSQIQASPPTRALLEGIETHRTEMEAILAALIVLWCDGSSLAMHTKEDLEQQLREGIEDLKQLKRALTSNQAGLKTCKVIEIENPSEHLDHEHSTMHHTDINNRQRLHPFLGKLRGPSTAELIPSASSGQSRPLNSALKQLPAKVNEGGCRKDDGQQSVVCRKRIPSNISNRH